MILGIVLATPKSFFHLTNDKGIIACFFDIINHTSKEYLPRVSNRGV